MISSDRARPYGKSERHADDLKTVIETSADHPKLHLVGVKASN
jgi:hypothetical protein